jgi:hypothetical protein
MTKHDKHNAAMNAKIQVSRVDPIFWVDGGTSRVVKYAATVDGVPIEAVTTFNVRKPTVSVQVETGKVAVDQRWDPQGLLALHLGSAARRGIQFTASGQPSAGALNWYQVLAKLQWIRISDHTVLPPGPWDTGSGCDTKCPYSRDTTAASDSPGKAILWTYLNGRLIAEQASTMYLMWKPVGNDVTEVPMIAIDWSWSASVICISNKWGEAYYRKLPSPKQSSTIVYPVWTGHVPE